MVIYELTGLWLTTTNIIQTVNICHNENYPLFVLVKYLTILCDSIFNINIKSISIKSTSISALYLYLHLCFSRPRYNIFNHLTTALNQDTGFKSLYVIINHQCFLFLITSYWYDRSYTIGIGIRITLFYHLTR